MPDGESTLVSALDELAALGTERDTGAAGGAVG